MLASDVAAIHVVTLDFAVATFTLDIAERHVIASEPAARARVNEALAHILTLIRALVSAV